MSLFLTAPAGGFDTNMLFNLLPIALIVVVFYFMLIRPESKKKKALTQLRNEIEIGDEITTIGGIVGKVVTVKEDTITLETGADKSRIKFMRWAISSKGEKPADA